MATHSGILAWRIPWTEEPGRLPFLGSQRVDGAINTFTLVRIKKKKGRAITRVNKVVDKLEPSYSDDNVKWYTHCKNSLVVPQGVKHRITT